MIDVRDQMPDILINEVGFAQNESEGPLVQENPLAADARSKAVYIETYGCQMNVSDSELIAGVFLNAGYRIAPNMDEADVILVNTCAVRERAEERVFGRLSELNRYKLRNPDLVLGVCGCMAKHLGEKISQRAPYVDIVASPDSYRRLPDTVGRISGEPLLDLKLDRDELYIGLDPLRSEGVTAWVTIMRGCDKFCSFCVVPYVRGRERGVPPQEVVRQVEVLASEGCKEVTLLGQTVSSYRYDGVRFADLLDMVSRVDGIERMRFTAPHPSDFSDKLIDTVARNDKVCNHVHLPLQSGSDRVLKAMKRDYTSHRYMNLVEKIRDRIPGVALTTDVIVGFCGETDDDFELTYDLMENVRFDSAFMFKYSPREGTSAYRELEDDVSEEVKSQRIREIIDLQESVSLEINRGFVGSTVKVMVDGTSKRDEDKLFGKTDGFKTVVFPKEGYSPGDIVDVKIGDATSHTLFG